MKAKIRVRRPNSTSTRILPRLDPKLAFTQNKYMPEPLLLRMLRQWPLLFTYYLLLNEKESTASHPPSLGLSDSPTNAE